MGATFANFQNGLIFRILAVFRSRFFALNNYNMHVECFSGCFWDV